MRDDVVKIRLLPRCERDLFRQDDRFAKTNSIWCDKKFNNPFNVGQTMLLVQGCKTRDEWCEKYIRSGLERKSLLKEKKLQNYDTQYGRTLEDLGSIAVVLRDEASKIGVELSLEEALATVVIRVVDDTWIGYERELSIFLDISTCTHLDVKHTSIQDDISYAVDGMLRDGDTLVCGIQIKPESYRAETPYLKKAKEINKQKNELFKGNYGVPVLYAYYDTKDGFVNKYEFLYFVSQLKEGKEIGLPF